MRGGGGAEWVRGLGRRGSRGWCPHLPHYISASAVAKLPAGRPLSGLNPCCPVTLIIPAPLAPMSAPLLPFCQDSNMCVTCRSGGQSSPLRNMWKPWSWAAAARRRKHSPRPGPPSLTSPGTETQKGTVSTGRTPSMTSTSGQMLQVPPSPSGASNGRLSREGKLS